MTDRKWKTWEVIGLLVTLALGNLLHFVYEWSGDSPLTAPVAAVNESTWEHMKLLAVPWILWTAVTILIERRADCAAPRAAGLLTGLILIPALFYTYTGICGKSVDVVNVLIFQAAVLAAWLVSRGLQRRGSLSAPLWQVLGILVQLGAAAVFAVWTVNPPELPLFVDPTNGTRGV